MAVLENSRRWKLIGGIVLITLALSGLFVGLWQHFNKPKHPADSVEFWIERFYSPEGQLEADLRALMIPEIDFSGKPLEECLDFVLEELNYGRKPDRETKYEFLVSAAKLDEGITLKLTHVPASEALRYVTQLAQLKYLVEENGIIRIVPLAFTSDETFEGKFFCPQFYYPSLTGKGPHSVIKELTEAGIAFRPGDRADYYPEKKVVIVSTTENQMDLVEAFVTPICSLPAPTLYEEITYRIQEFFNPSPPLPPPPPIPSGAATDPFGTPDPFATPGNREVDPFRAQ